MHAGSIEHFGVRYEAGDVIGCFIDVKEQTISKKTFRHTINISTLQRLFNYKSLRFDRTHFV